jgi:hypothetical protein
VRLHASSHQLTFLCAAVAGGATMWECICSVKYQRSYMTTGTGYICSVLDILCCHLLPCVVCNQFVRCSWRRHHMGVHPAPQST